MPIEARDLAAAAREFQGTLNSVLNRTVSQMRLVATGLEGDLVRVAPRQQGVPTSISLATARGPMAFDVMQVCGAKEMDTGGVRLFTNEYRYALTAQDSEDPWVRWEYVRERPVPAPRKWNRHHLQGNQQIVFSPGVEPASLNDLHLPTGWVPLEEVLRFIIVDLEVAPLDPSWDSILDESYQRFKNDFLPPPGER